MFRNTLTAAAAVLALAGATVSTTEPAQARGLGGGFNTGGFHGNRGIAVGEPNPGMPHRGGFHHHGGWGRGFGWHGVGFTPIYSYGYGCYARRFIDNFGNVVVRRVCD